LFILFVCLFLCVFTFSFVTMSQSVSKLGLNTFIASSLKPTPQCYVILFVYVSACLSVFGCLSVLLSLCLSFYLSVCPSVSLSLCRCVSFFSSSSRTHTNFILFHYSLRLSVYLLSICPFVGLSVCPCVSFVASSSSHSLKTKTIFCIQAESEFHGPASNTLALRDTLNYTVKFRGIYTVGWKYRRKTPNTVG
jgi:hypothetical protein